MRNKILLLVLVMIFSLGLASCNKKKAGIIDFYNSHYDEIGNTGNVIKEKNPKTNKDMYYYKAPESNLVFDRNVIFIGDRYEIDIDLCAILKEDGGWDSYEFKKINPTQSTIQASTSYGSENIEFDSINENAFDIEKNYIVGKELGHYGVYLILTREKEKRYLYIGDYVVTDKEYSNFIKISTAEDWFSLNTNTMKYCILANDIKLPKPEGKAPVIYATFLINPNHYVIDFGGYEYTDCIIQNIISCYFENITFQNVRSSMENCRLIGYGVHNTLLRNVSFLDFHIDSASSGDYPKFSMWFRACRLKGVTIEVELFADGFKLISTPVQDPCVYEDMVILIKPQVEEVMFEFPVSNIIDYSLFKNVLIVNTNKENNLILTLTGYTSRDRNDVYINEGLKNQIINVYGLDCEIFYKDLEKGNWYFKGNK